MGHRAGKMRVEFVANLIRLANSWAKFKRGKLRKPLMGHDALVTYRDRPNYACSAHFSRPYSGLSRVCYNCRANPPKFDILEVVR